jgi:hypothetical protein
MMEVQRWNGSALVSSREVTVNDIDLFWESETSRNASVRIGKQERNRRAYPRKGDFNFFLFSIGIQVISVDFEKLLIKQNTAYFSSTDI